MAGAACTNEGYNLFPTIATCPPDNALVMLLGVPGQQGGYAAVPIGILRRCFLSGLTPKYLQFTIGQPGSPMTAGQTVLTINQANIIDDSVSVVLGGVVLDRNDSSQISYQVAYGSDDVVITFNQGVETTQTYIIFYNYAQ